jgi:hypothetical protein
MRIVDGRSHHHDEYKSEPDTFTGNFLPAFKGWNDAGLARGVQILNATPGSALTEFPMVDLADVLGGLPAEGRLHPATSGEPLAVN